MLKLSVSTVKLTDDVINTLKETANEVKKFSKEIIKKLFAVLTVSRLIMKLVK